MMDKGYTVFEYSKNTPPTKSGGVGSIFYLRGNEWIIIQVDYLYKNGTEPKFTIKYTDTNSWFKAHTFQPIKLETPNFKTMGEVQDAANRLYQMRGLR